MKHCLLRSSTDQTNRTQATQPQLGEHESNRLVYQEPSLHNHREKTYVRPDIREREQRAEAGSMQKKIATGATGSSVK